MEPQEPQKCKTGAEMPRGPDPIPRRRVALPVAVVAGVDFIDEPVRISAPWPLNWCLGIGGVHARHAVGHSGSSRRRPSPHNQFGADSGQGRYRTADRSSLGGDVQVQFDLGRRARSG